MRFAARQQVAEHPHVVPGDIVEAKRRSAARAAEIRGNLEARIDALVTVAASRARRAAEGRRAPTAHAASFRRKS